MLNVSMKEHTVFIAHWLVSCDRVYIYGSLHYLVGTMKKTIFLHFFFLVNYLLETPVVPWIKLCTALTEQFFHILE